MRRATTLAGDLSALPDHNVGSKSLGWWGIVGLMLIGGTGVALAIGAYFFLVTSLHGAPSDAGPALGPASAFIALALLGGLPNAWTARVARARKAGAMRRGLAVTSVLGIALLALRGFEIAALDVRWDRDAYGSIVWALLLLHTVFIASGVLDTLVLAALAWTRRFDGSRFGDVANNALYWHFIVGSGVLVYLVLYWTPRWS